MAIKIKTTEEMGNIEILKKKFLIREGLISKWLSINKFSFSYSRWSIDDFVVGCLFTTSEMGPRARLTFFHLLLYYCY